MQQFHLRISDSLADQLDEMKKRTDASSISSVLRDAVCLYAWFLNHVTQGHEIIAISDSSRRQQFNEQSATCSRGEPHHQM